MLSRINGRVLAAVVLALAVVAGFLAFSGGSGTRTVTAHFPQAVSVYKGTDVDIMGVPVGRVTAVVPEGDSVRVDIEYDAKYRLPADVKAAVVTPTLVADRFVQLAPAYGGGATLPDGGDIPISRTAVPVELDQIYSSLADLTNALGPNGANKSGALNQLLRSGAHALKGNGRLGHQMLANLAGAVQTLGDNSGQLFDTVDSLASVTQTLQANDKVVGRFMDHLSQASTQLAGERGDLRKALVAIANALSTVRNFVHDNKGMLVGDIKQLTTTVGVLARKKQTLAKVLTLAPLGLGNLAEAFDPKTGTVGIRLQLGPTALDFGNMICNVVQVNHMPNADQACTLLKALLPNAADLGAGLLSAPTPGTSGMGAAAPANGLGGLLGGGL
ncbi:MCE family protein [Nocardioides terrisoli]|uniref:MCE family protein n=1 Tax=Nocardioides terrisoli TaxID=3388267 RepID=UPI00287BC48F|nr:MCE family protein [Nocardioides marmorisolisilvae]